MPISIDCHSLANLLRSQKRHTIVGLSACTIPEMRKTENPYFGRVKKYARLTAVIGGSYESAVNRRREKEAAAAGKKSVRHFTAGERKWGRREKRTIRKAGRRGPIPPLVRHKGKLYLNLQRQQIQFVEYRDVETNEVIPPEQIVPWLKPRHEAKRQELDDPVICRDYTLTNVLELRMHGKIYSIRPA